MCHMCVKSIWYVDLRWFSYRQSKNMYISLVNQDEHIGPHLTDDEHVLSLDDTLLHLGFQRPTNISFILITVSCVNVAITSSDGGFYCTLNWGAEKMGGLQQVKRVYPGCRMIPVSRYVFTSLKTNKTMVKWMFMCNSHGHFQVHVFQCRLWMFKFTLTRNIWTTSLKNVHKMTLFIWMNKYWMSK